MEGGAAVDARTFQTEALKIEKLLYHISYAMLRNESDCEDAVQEALLRAWQKRGTLRDMAAFRSWLCRIVANTCTELLRRKQRTTLTDIPEEMPAPQSDAIDHMAVMDALAELTPQMRACMTLHYLDGWRVPEIAQMLDIPEGDSQNAADARKKADGNAAEGGGNVTDEQMKKLLEEDTGEVPERFHQAMLAAFGQMEDEPFDGTELPISVEAAEKPRRPRHVPRQGGRFRRMMLVMLITLGLLGGLAVATTANPRLLEVFWGKDFEPSAQASAYIAHDLAEVETNGYRVRVEEAVYDGMTLYVRYSIRDMSCDHLLGETNVDTGRRMLNEDEITAFDHAPVGWWTDNLWLNGQNVDMPGLSGGETWAGDENGEIVVSEMYRLDQVGVFLSGDVQIDLPIGEKQHYDYEMWQSMLKEDGTFRKPDAGLVSFTLNCDAPVTHYADGERVILPDGTAAWVESADDTPVKLYVTVRFEISDAQREAFRAENGEGYVFPDGTVMPFDDVDMVGSWVYGLTLVDADGKPLRASLGYGEGNWGVGSGVADYVFSHEDAYPEQVYLAPQTGEDSADMAWAIPLPVRE